MKVEKKRMSGRKGKGMEKRRRKKELKWLNE